MSMGQIGNAQRAAIQRALNDRAGLRYGVITNYDPASHMAIVKVMPEEVLTGWLPIMVQWVGNGFGLYIGPAVEDQVLVAHVEGDPNAGIIIGRLNSDAEKPTSVPTGEAWIVHKTGSFLKFMTNGDVQLTTHNDLIANVGRDLTAAIARNVDLTAAQVVVHCDDINLGGTGGKHVALDQDPVSANKVQASSTKVKAL